jgi:DNA-binding MarR family transcriptional regulator
MKKQEKQQYFSGTTNNQSEELKNLITDKLKLDADSQISINLVRKKYPQEDWIMVTQISARWMAKELSGSSVKVFQYFLGISEYSNHIAVSQTTIAENTNQSLITVKKAIQQLLEFNIIIKYADQQDNRRNVYIIHPTTAWRGKVTERIKALRRIDADNNNQIKLFNNKENS